MKKFRELANWTVFNTKIARFMKGDSNKAVVIMSGVLEINSEVEFQGDEEVIPLSDPEDRLKSLYNQIKSTKVS